MNITTQLCHAVGQMNAKFTLNNKPIEAEKALAPIGLLPAIARRADQLCSLCFGYGIGISFEEAASSHLGVEVRFDDITPNILRLMMMIDVVADLVRVAPSADKVALDELLYD